MNSIPAFVSEAYRPWVWSAAVLVAAALGAWVVHWAIYFVAERITRETEGVAGSSIVLHTRRPAKLVFLLLAFQVVLPSLPLDSGSIELLREALSVAVIGSLTWLVIEALSVIDDVMLSRHPIDIHDNLEARRLLTQTRVLSQTAMIVVGVIGFAAALMVFPKIRQFGASLLASAGIAGLALGLAARPMIANLIAGLQLALTQPIRLDDVVIIENEWGRIEEITATYVVVRIWDERRLVVPLQYFIDHPFQNWTRRTSDILGSVFIHTDYSVPVEAVRQELRRIVEGSDKWDGKVCGVQVTDSNERTVELRALVSAANSGNAWDLRCLVREKLIGFLQERYPECLPRLRAEMLSPPEAPPKR